MNIYSVEQVNTYIKNMFTQDFLLRRIYVKGEVSNCKYHTSGHIYFSLKDKSGVMACVMFAKSRRGLAFPMKDGDQVVVEGNISVYERDGRYQLYAKNITLEGFGILYERFQALKQELEEMGMFAQEYKQPIPHYIKKESIVKGIQMLDSFGVDTIIIGRGGGSIEDLWAFNEEEVARAIFNCETPIISAVGHETDFTIADFAADMRAPTPSAAAELAVDDYRGLMQQMGNYQKKLDQAMENRILLLRSRLVQYQTRFNYLSPQNQIQEQRQRLMDLEEKLEQRMKGVLEKYRHRLEIYAGRMDGVSPLKKLNQGFSYVSDEKGHTVSTITQVQRGDSLRIQVTDGSIRARVEDITLEERKEHQIWPEK